MSKIILIKDFLALAEENTNVNNKHDVWEVKGKLRSSTITTLYFNCVRKETVRFVTCSSAACLHFDKQIKSVQSQLEELHDAYYLLIMRNLTLTARCAPAPMTDNANVAKLLLCMYNIINLTLH